MGTIPEEDLIEDIQRVGDELGHPPRIRDYEELGEYSTYPIKGCFGTWSDGLRAAGYREIDLHKNGIPVSRLVTELIDLTVELGRIPGVEDMDRDGGVSRSTYQRNFGTWGETLQMFGLEIPETDDTGTSTYGMNWKEQRRRALGRDRFRCQSANCGMTHNEHKEEYDGEGLHVHHIVRVRAFDRPEDANFLENLITLCDEHHLEWERNPPDVDISKLVEERREIATSD